MDELILQVRGLCVRSEQGRVLVEIPRLSLRRGEALGIAGASGAGKSTLLFALAGLVPGAQGQVRWQGQDLLAMPARRRAAFRADHIGLVFQDHMLFEELDAPANAAIQAGFRPRAERAALRAEGGRLLAALGLAGKGADVARLSGGERQRVAVARALAHRPQVLLADEPTASLDAATAEALTGDLLGDTGPDRGRQGRSLIVVSHDPALLARMDRVIRLDHGRMVDPAEAAA